MDSDHAQQGDNLKFNSFEYDDGPYFDMDFYDVTLPLEEDNNTDSSEEFEFGISCISARNREPYYPADNLFYEGHLLPLHPPRRLEMVRNLSMSKESQVDKEVSTENVISFPNKRGDFHFSRFLFSGFRDSINQRSTIAKQAEFISAEPKKTQQSQTVEKSSNKFKVSLFGLRRSSEVGNQDDPHSTRCSPPVKHLSGFAIKSKTIKIPIRFFAKSHESHKSPYQLSRSTSAKGVFHKYLRMMKHIISHGDDNCISRDHDQVQVEDKYDSKPSIIAGGLRKGANHSVSNKLKMSFYCIGGCPPSTHSSPLYDGAVVAKSHLYELQSAVQEAIAYCKQSNGINDT